MPGVAGVPASVSRLTVVVDGWGRDEINPVDMSGAGFLNDYLNVALLQRDYDHTVVSQLATEWSLDDGGFEFTIHPNAKWHTGRDITAADIDWNIRAHQSEFAPNFVAFDDQRFIEAVEGVEIIDDKHVKIKTFSPFPDFIAWHTGMGYHIHHYGDSEHIQAVGEAGFNDNPSGGGPYTVDEWKPGERIVFERWEDFWGDTDWYHKPQHQSLEIILNVDAPSRFALLKSEQADIVVNIPYISARDIDRSEEFVARGVNPGRGGIWTQTIRGTGNMNIDFMNVMCIIDCAEKPTLEEVKPFDDIRVREALEIAVDKVAISENAHYGFTTPQTGIWFSNSFGYIDRPVSEFNPERAKQLLEEAGYGDGFKSKVYYGPFVNSPGIKEWLEAAASYWLDVGIEMEIFEIESSEFYSKCCREVSEGTGKNRQWRPLAVQTWGRQEHAGVLVNYGYHETGSYNCCYDATTEALWKELNSTTDETAQQRVLTELEDYVLEKRWLLPMDEVSVVQGYLDRVLTHPTAPHASSFEQLWRVVLAD